MTDVSAGREEAEAGNEQAEGEHAAERWLDRRVCGEGTEEGWIDTA